MEEEVEEASGEQAQLDREYIAGLEKGLAVLE
jgi:hypothetical protein